MGVLRDQFIALLIAGFVMACSCFAQSSGVSRLSLDGTQLVNDAGEPVVLRGVSYGWHNWWPRFYNEGSVKWLKDDWGVDIVRAATGIEFKEPELTYNEDPEQALAIVSKVIDAAIKHDLYVIIDFHSHDLEVELAKTFFNEMAARYGRYPHVIYEIFNEPIEQSWADVKAYSEDVIKVIRAHDSDNIILIGTPTWSQDVHIAAKDPITMDDRLMYSVHYYAATHGEDIRAQADIALAHGLPLFISESAGMAADGDGPVDQAAWAAWRAWGESNKVSWITWGIADEGDSSHFLHSTAASDGNWNLEDLNETAIQTRAMLRAFAGKDEL